MLLKILICFLSFEKWVEIKKENVEETYFFNPVIKKIENDIYVLIGVHKGEDGGNFIIFKNGKRIFNMDIKAPIYHGIDIINLNKEKFFIFGAYDGSIYLVDIKNLKIVKKFNMDTKRIRELRCKDLNKDGFDEIVVIGEDFDKIEIRDGKDFKKIYGYSITNTPILYGNLSCINVGIFNNNLFISEGNKIRCMEIKDSIWKTKWETSVGSRRGYIFFVFPFPLFITDMKIFQNTLYLSTFAGEIILMNINDGKIKKRIDLGKQFIITKVTFFDLNEDNISDIIAVGYNGYIFAIDGFTYKTLWKFKLTSEIFYLPLIIESERNTYIFIVDANFIHILDRNEKVIDKMSLPIGTLKESGQIIAGDIDGDSLIEIILACNTEGILFISHTDFKSKEKEIIRSSAWE